MERVRHAPKGQTAGREPAIQEAAVEPALATSVLLAAERVTAAQTLLSLRQLEMQVLMSQVRVQYEEGGAFVVLDIDGARGVVRRVPKASGPIHASNGSTDAAVPTSDKQ